MSSNSSYLSDYDYDDPVSNVVGEIIIYFVLIYFALIILTVVIAACKCCLQDYYFAYTLRRRQAATAAAAATTDSAGSIQVVIHRDISSLPTTHTYADPASICAICIREYKDGDVERVLPQCGHAFHRSCIDPWLMDHATCPICRASTVAAAQPPP